MQKSNQSEYDFVAKTIEDMFKKRDSRSGATCIVRKGEKAE